MITVAQRSEAPIIPIPRSRFTALTVARDTTQLAGLAPRLRSFGAVTVHVAATARAGAAPRPTSSTDVCVVDGHVTDLAEELRWLARTGWRRIVVVAARPELARAAIASGARSVVIPPTPAATSEVAAARPAAPARRRLAEDLSDREIQVLQRVADGHTNRQIGDDLCLSALTVKSHLARIARKLGTGDRAEMVAIGIRNGVVA